MTLKAQNFKKHLTSSLALTIALAISSKSHISQSAAFPELALQATKEYAEDYANKALELYKKLLAENVKLQEACILLSQTPTQQNLQAAQEAWKKARDVYSMTEVFRFYAGPIDDPKTGPEGFMNAWPIDESYLDGVKKKPKSGIVFNKKLFPKITAEALEAANEKDGEKNVSTGYHAIEFLLWGQDFSTTHAGQRKASEFGGSVGSFTHRRSQMLQVQNEILVKHSKYLVESWEVGKQNYRQKFLAEEPQAQLKKIWTGISSLASDELAGERMIVPLERNDAEHEQDCFSDYTTQDFIGNVKGIRLVLGSESLGTAKIISTLPSEKLSGVPQKIEKLFSEVESSVQKIKSPFDSILVTPKLSPERETVKATHESLAKFSSALADTAVAFGIRLNVSTEERY
jgi:putative iron-regulated protein